MKKFFKDFKDFINKGNIIELAVAVVIGGAFSKIVSSFVANIITPLIGLIAGRVNLDDLKIVMRAADEATGVTELALSYGVFLQALVDFLIIALCIFTVLRILKRLTTEAKKHAEETREHIKKIIDEHREDSHYGDNIQKDEQPKVSAAQTAAEVSPQNLEADTPIDIAPENVQLLREIRDLLKTKSDS